MSSNKQVGPGTLQWHAGNVSEPVWGWPPHLVATYLKNEHEVNNKYIHQISYRVYIHQRVISAYIIQKVSVALTLALVWLWTFSIPLLFTIHLPLRLHMSGAAKATTLFCLFVCDGNRGMREGEDAWLRVVALQRCTSSCDFWLVKNTTTHGNDKHMTLITTGAAKWIIIIDSAGTSIA